MTRGYSYTIKGPCINVPSSVQNTIAKILPQDLNVLLTPIALKRKLSYISDYIFQEIQIPRLLGIFKKLKFTFKNPHYKEVVFSKQLMERETDEFVNNCKAQVENMEKQDDNVKEEGTPNCTLLKST